MREHALEEPDPMDASEHEKLVALAWDGEPSHRDGPRRSMSVARVLDGAIQIADANGLAACSMPKLAAHLGVGTMSLYRYVPAKSVLTVLMMDRATEPVPAGAPGPGGPWQDALAYYAERGIARYRSHPWMLDVPVTGFPQTPRQLAWLELGLGALASVGFEPQHQLGAMLLIDGHVVATARLARGAAGAGPAPSEPPADRIGSGGFPQLSHLVSTGALRDDDFSDYGFQFGLGRIIEGIAQLEKPA
jgi:AcrR family transcriptional regulator